MRPFTSETAIDPSALVHPGAELDPGVRVGPFAVIGPRVRLGAGTEVGAHAVVQGRSTLGRNNRVFPFAAVGGDPQDLKFRGEDTELIMGDDNLVRECCTLNRGTAEGGGATRIGNGNLFMAYCHVAHDCHIGNGAIFANNGTLGGHVEVGDGAVFGGFAGVHQFCRVGRLAMLGAAAVVVQDVPPFVTVQGDRARLMGLNAIGMERKGFSPAAISAVKGAYKALFVKPGVRSETIPAARKEFGAFPEAEELIAFVEGSKRGVVRR